MIKQTNPFQYTELSRIESDNGRQYVTPTGNLPSVTTILSATKSAESVEKLDNWRNRIGENNAKQITKEASDVGTLVHSIMEHWMLGLDFTIGNNLIHRQAKMMAEKIKQNISPHIDELWGSEVKLYYPDLYAGTCDGICVWNGTPAIIDFKQTNKPKKESWIDDYKNQIVAYAMAHNKLYGTNIKEGHIIMCSRNGDYQQFDLMSSDYDFWEDKWLDRIEQYYSLK